MPGRLEFEVQFRGAKRAPSFGSAARMRILMLGDFSGRGARGVLEGDVAGRPLVRVDADSFDDVMVRMAPRLVLAPPVDDRVPEMLGFATIDDFHPDRLVRRLEVFAGFAALRARLLDSSTFAQAADALEPRPAAAPAGEDTLARLLGGKVRETATPAADISAFLRQVVAPHVVPAPDDRQPRLVAAVDQAAAEHLRTILHHPAVQRLEAAWRALHRIVRDVESEDLQIFLLDVGRPQLIADQANGPAASGLLRKLQEKDPFSLLVLDETFGAGEEDLALLSALGATAAQAGAALIAGADPRLDWSALPDADAARWRALRESEHARAIGLALPRWLLRLPYGPKTDPIESFPFDELAGERNHEAYLWGNPAFACALLAAAAFRDSGAEMELGQVQEIDDLPAHTYRADGESHLQPCAEVLMPERVMTALLGQGLIPLVSQRDRNALRVARFQSIASPPAPLSGPWR